MGKSLAFICLSVCFSVLLNSGRFEITTLLFYMVELTQKLIFIVSNATSLLQVSANSAMRCVCSSKLENFLSAITPRGIYGHYLPVVYCKKLLKKLGTALP